MNPINFLPPDSDILSWKKQDSPVFGDSGVRSVSGFWLQRKFVIPWVIAALTVVTSWSFPLFNNRSAVNQISDLEFDHSQFLTLTARIAAAEQELEQQKADIRDFSVLFTSASPAYPFTFNLQRSIPSQVNLNSFALDSSSFNLCAFASNYKSLEDLIDLLKAMPSVDANTVRFTNMSSDPSTLSSSPTCQSLSALQPVSALVKGAFLVSTPSDLEKLYSGAIDYGQYNKLRLYNSLVEKMGGG